MLDYALEFGRVRSDQCNHVDLPPLVLIRRQLIDCSDSYAKALYLLFDIWAATIPELDRRASGLYHVSSDVSDITLYKRADQANFICRKICK